MATAIGDFSRKKLLDMIDQGLRNHRAAYDAAEKRKATKRAEEAAAWEERYGGKWDEALRKVQAARRKSQPVTACMMPTMNDRYRCGDTAYYAPSSDSAAKEYEAPKDLLQLKAVLDAMVTDTVSLTKFGLANVQTIAHGTLK